MNNYAIRTYTREITIASYAIAIFSYTYSLYITKYARLEFMSAPSFLTSILLALALWIYTSIDDGARLRETLQVREHVFLSLATMMVLVAATMMLNPYMLEYSYVWKTIMVLSLQVFFHLSVNTAIRTIFKTSSSQKLVAAIFYIFLPLLFVLSVFGQEIRNPLAEVFVRLFIGYFYPALIYSCHPREYENLSLAIAIVYMLAASMGLRILLKRFVLRRGASVNEEHAFTS